MFIHHCPFGTPHSTPASSPGTATEADAVANFVIVDCRERGEVLSVRKLHILLYYAQAWHMQRYGSAIFEEDFNAGVSGPRLPSQLLRFGVSADQPIMCSLPVPRTLHTRLRRHLRDIVLEFGSQGAHALECMVTSEDPWRRARAGWEPLGECSSVVSKKAMQAYCQYLQDVA